MSTYNNSIILHLSLIDGVGPVTIKKIHEFMLHNLVWHDLYSFSKKDWQNKLFFSEKMAHKIVVGLSDNTLLLHEYTYIEKYGINYTTIIDETYPALLKHIVAPPPVLYWYGTLISDNEKTIAFVGSRAANYYAEKVINIFVPQLVHNKWTIVSGGAIGADTMAHRATIAAGGKTIVVLGSGLLYPYPHVNKKLFDDIIVSGGAIVSAFPINTTAKPGNFPARNRIIAGLSKGIVVVQAAEKSGARITAAYALQEGRDVFAIPGPINDILSAGCHALIKEGATLVHSVEDIMKEFEYTVFSRNKVTFVESIEDTMSNSIVENDSNNTSSYVLGLCQVPVHFDELIVNANLKKETLESILFDLQLTNQIQQDFTGRWLAV